MDYRTLEIRKQLMNGKYALGFHVRSRIEEQNIYDVANLIFHLGSAGQVDTGFNQKGQCWTFDADFHGLPYRMVVGPHRYDPQMVYIISLFEVKPGIQKGQNYRKFDGQTMSYSFEFTFEAA